MPECPCVNDPQPANYLDARKCAFLAEEFSDNNWACLTMAALRELGYDREVYSEDQHCSVIPYNGAFIVLGYYKHRGRTEYAGVLMEDVMEPLTFTIAQNVINALVKR